MRPLNNENDLQRMDQISVSTLYLVYMLLPSYTSTHTFLYFLTDGLCTQALFFPLQLDKLRPEFRSGLDALTKYVFERTRPKQIGATVMTGPVLVGITESYLEALNNGAVPTISSSWQVCTLL